MEHVHPGAAMPTIEDLDELAALLDRARGDEDLYVRWSRGPDVDLAGETNSSSPAGTR